ncbi:MAG: hypothetical protein LQ346_007850 [Caloplaca aetnensis]|nr:MAG: hypothetical protein LQ346_007850 [Caloplaca aetnensis]
MGRFADLPPGVRYRVFALAHVYQWHIDSDKNPPSRALMRRALTGEVGQRVTWQEVHLEAQVQGLLYSLRWLKQSATYLESIGVGGERDGGEQMVRLGRLLEDLPDLGALCPSWGEIRELWADGGVDVTGLLDFVLYPDADVDVDEGGEVRSQIDLPDAETLPEHVEDNSGWQEAKRRKGKRKPKSTTSEPQESIPTGSTNLYNLLPS